MQIPDRDAQLDKMEVQLARAVEISGRPRGLDFGDDLVSAGHTAGLLLNSGP